jgi:alpha-beta hydrolase superfamily lysophospholipase
MTVSDEVRLLQAVDSVRVVYRRWLPEGDARGTVQIVHGASEHSGRYGRLAAALTDRDLAVYAMDLRGHGRTAESSGIGRYGGSAGERAGVETVLGDVDGLQQVIADEHPAVPRILLGHSMGSVIALAAAEKHGPALAGLVLSGALGVNDDLAQTVSALEAAVDAGMAEDPLDLGTFNQAFEPARTRYDWLSRDTGEVDAYIADPLSGDDMPLTYAYAAGVFGLSVRAASPEGVGRLPENLPVLLLSGERDPVGGEAAAFVTALGRLMEKRGLPVERRIYPDARHEVFNETNRDEVVADLTRWLEQRIAD